MPKATRPSLRDRANAIPPRPGGRPCGLARSLDALDDADLKAEAVELILDPNIIGDNVVATLAAPDVGIRATVDQITRHRRRTCEWCRVMGTIPQ